jgi:hypothetical protein
MLQKKRWWLLAFVPLILISTVFLMSWRGSLAGNPVTLIDSQHGTIRMSASFDPVGQQLHGEVEYDYLSDKGVKEYITFSREMSQQIAQRSGGLVRIKVNFSRPLSAQEFKEFVKMYELQVNAYTMRAVEKNGIRVTISGGADGDQLIPPHFFNLAVTDVAAAAEFHGFIDADVTTTPALLGEMQKDARVFVTEAAYTLIYDTITPQALRQLNASEEAIQQAQWAHVVIGSSLYWGLEDYGLVPMPKHSAPQ